MTELDAVRRGRSGGSAGCPLLAPLAVRDYRFVWLGESVSLLGDQFNTVALAWLVLGLTGSGFALGAILIAAAIPRGAVPARRRRPVRPHLAARPGARLERPARRS